MSEPTKRYGVRVVKGTCYWTPSPRWRKYNITARKLVEADGRPMTEARALIYAKAYVESLERDLAAGVLDGRERTPKPRMAFAPSSLDRTFGAAVARYRESQHFNGLLAPRTRDGYSNHLDFILANSDWGARDLALLTPDEIKNFFLDYQSQDRQHTTLSQRKTKGRVSTGHAMFRTFRVVYNYAINDLRWREVPPLGKIKLRKPDGKGRIVVWGQNHVDAVVSCAEAYGYFSVADAVELGLTTALNPVDLIALPVLTPATIAGFEWKRTKSSNKDSGGDCQFLATPMLLRRLDVMAKRRAELYPDQGADRLLLRMRPANSDTGAPVVGAGAPYPDTDMLHSDFHRVKLAATGFADALGRGLQVALGARRPVKVKALPFTPEPSLVNLQFADLRDTAITYLMDATGSANDVAKYSGHSPATAATVIAAHYGKKLDTVHPRALGAFDSFLAKPKLSVVEGDRKD